jgi:hypothetical protein
MGGQSGRRRLVRGLDFESLSDAQPRRNQSPKFGLERGALREASGHNLLKVEAPSPSSQFCRLDWKTAH